MSTHSNFSIEPETLEQWHAAWDARQHEYPAFVAESGEAVDIPLANKFTESVENWTAVVNLYSPYYVYSGPLKQVGACVDGCPCEVFQVVGDTWIGIQVFCFRNTRPSVSAASIAEVMRVEGNGEEIRAELAFPYRRKDVLAVALIYFEPVERSGDVGWCAPKLFPE